MVLQQSPCPTCQFLLDFAMAFCGRCGSPNRDFSLEVFQKTCNQSIEAARQEACSNDHRSMKQVILNTGIEDVMEGEPSDAAKKIEGFITMQMHCPFCGVRVK